MVHSNLAGAFVSFTFKDDLASVFVGVGYAAPSTDGVRVLLGSVNFNLNGEGVVLAQDVLYGVDVVLTHIAKTTSVVVPVSAEGLVSTVNVVGLEGCGAQPEVVVEVLGHLLNLEVFLTHPEELPGKAGCTRDANLQGPTQLAAVNQLLQGLNIGSQSVECILEAEPCVQTEDTAVTLYGFFNALTFADGTGHGLFAEDVLSCIGSLNRHDTVPVGRSGNVNDIHIGIVNQFTEVVVGLYCFVPVLLGCRNGRIQVFLVNIAHCNHTAALVADKV